MIPALTMVIIALCVWISRMHESKKKLENAGKAVYLKAEEYAGECDRLSRELLSVKIDRDIYKDIIDKHISRDFEMHQEKDTEIATLKATVAELERFIADEGIEIEWVDVESEFIKK